MNQKGILFTQIPCLNSAFCGVVMIMGSTCLSAQQKDSSESEAVTSLQTVKVTEKQTQQDLAIDASELELEQAWNTADLFDTTPLVDVGGGSPNARRLYLRGISDSLMSITLDGARQSKDLRCGRGSLAAFDADLLKTVEVEAGPTAADQGYGTLGGKISLTTKDAQDMLVDGEKAGLFAKTSYASASEAWKNTLAAYGESSGVGVLFYASNLDSENYRAGNGEDMPATAEEIRSYLAKISILDVMHHDLRISYENTSQEGLFAWSSPCDMGQITDESLASRQKLERDTFTINHSFNPDNELINSGLNFYINDSSLENLDNGSEYKSDGIGGDLRNTFAFNLGQSSSKLTAGVDYYEEKGSSTTGEVTSDNVGFYFQNRLQYKHLKLSAGARFDSYETDFDGKSVSGDAVSPNVNASIELGHGFSLYSAYGISNSGSNTLPVNWITNFASNLKFNGSEDGKLDPEEAEKIEGGLRYDAQNVFMDSDSLSFTVTLFNTTISDAIIAGTGGPKMKAVSDIINDPDDIESEGFEFEVSWSYKSFDSTLTYIHSDVKKGGETVGKAIKRTASGSGDSVVWDLDYLLNKQISLGYTLTVVQDNDDNDTGKITAEGYVLHGVQVRYYPKYFKRMTVILAVSNIFDKEYASQTTLADKGDPVLEPGRDIRVSVSYNF